MKCYAVQHNLTEPDRGNSGLRPYCIATLSGFLVEDNIMQTDDYFYGMFDGEGCVVNYKRKDTGGPRAHRIEITVTNTHLGVLQEFQNRYGGRIKVHNNGNNKNWKKCYRWILDGHYAARWLMNALGHILIKEPDAVKALNDFLLYRTKLTYFPNAYYDHCKNIGHKYHLNRMGKVEREQEHKYREKWFRGFYGFCQL